MGDLHGSGLPLGGTGLTVESYADFLAREYLGDYLRAGGAAVRFVVTGDPTVGQRWHETLRSTAGQGGYLHVAVDAAHARVHMVDSVYAAVARAVDWPALARAHVRRAWEAVDLPATDAESLTVEAVAAHHGVDVREARRTIRRRLERVILNDDSLAREFRVAALRLCQAELVTGDVTSAERDALIAWLRMEPVGMRVLRSAGVVSRVSRHNARAMLLSVAEWRWVALGAGLVLDLDLTRLAMARRPPVEQRDGFYYSKAAVLDAYEVLRQLLDGMDQLRGSLVAVTVPADLLIDEVRGIPAYAALHLRVVDEVRDRRRANPFAALVRLETRMEAVP
ncbi:MAG: DUF2791 family P-loop domain-containing protein [Actinomycetota bacterium]|nr:DUF2791 family P-loop domain-containing protein [Actinomycetota bacterium]